MISFKQLTYALAVANTRHFKRAAEQCAISQSALSTAISELESQLGTQLFERDNKKVLVTPVGEQILARATAIKLELEDIYRLAQEGRTPLSYPLTMGVIPTIGPYLLPKVLPAVRRDFPDFRLSIAEQQSHLLVEKVRNGELDTAVIALPYAHDGLLAFPFWEEDLFLVTHRDSPLGRHKQVNAEQLRDINLMLLKDGHCLKDHALAVCHLQASRLGDTLEGASLYTLIQMVAGHMGSTLVPEMALDQLLSGSSELQALRLDEPGPHRSIAFIVRPNFGGVGNIDVLKATFRQALAENLAGSRQQQQ
ncbi:hydrogen peroxide-inducible genes activator [Kineobactrum salinum]|uniref:Hydrogen peroxide-inducible genes activator n=1 Tax=Kineobactrum salinum TaxID=2708301 RepID=A0A6C0U7W9_9GAMM|nr:hydrogen peroxide-inducible genes activator [Kineobactrum salinum]QIB65584.1 hydrogen peroxide-inducible genes activator [Kineobactrum salinum]